jgi:zinc protease
VNRTSPLPLRTFTRSLTLTVALTLGAGSAALAVDRSAPPVPGAVAPFVLPTPVEFKLKNGVPVYFLERHRAPVVDVVAVVTSGALDEAAGKEGTATALAGLLTQGAVDAKGAAKDAFAFDDAVRALGADISGEADWTTMQLALHTASSRLDPALALFADALLRPRLEADDWERKQKEALGELAYLSDEPRALVAIAASRAVFGDTRPGLPLIGTPRSVSAVDVADVRAFHKSAVQAGGLFLVVVGDIDQAALAKKLEAQFGALPASTSTPPRALRARGPEPVAIAARRVVLLDRKDAPQTAVHVVGTPPTDLAPLHAPTAVMQTLLGGSFTSRLNNNLREVHQYAYGAGYSISSQPWHKSAVQTSVAAPVSVAAVDEILVELARIRTPATTEEVERARAFEALGFPAVLDGGRALAGTWAYWKSQGLKNEDLMGYMAKVLKVDAAAVAAAAVAAVDPDRVVIVVVGDRATALKDAGKWGPVELVTAEMLLPQP